jgi:uncharacterized protein YijF (DUF1287 family)
MTKPEPEMVELEKVLSDFVQTPEEWGSEPPEDNLDWRRGYESAGRSAWPKRLGKTSPITAQLPNQER